MKNTPVKSQREFTTLHTDKKYPYAYPTPSHSVVSHHVISFHILSYPILSYPFLSYPILSYPIKHTNLFGCCNSSVSGCVR